MSYTVKLAIFPPWKAPVPYATIDRSFATIAEAAKAGGDALASAFEEELAILMPHLEPVSGRDVAAVRVPEVSVHGFVIYDADNVEVGNWTTLDVAVSRGARG
jgi:hypothetical protein